MALDEEPGNPVARRGADLLVRSRFFSLAVMGVAVTPDGKRIASAGYDRLYFWDLETGKEAGSIPLPGKEARLCFGGHATMENRNGLAVNSRLTQAHGRAEPSAALDAKAEARAFDGISYTIGHPSQWRRFREEVVPILRERGIVRTEYESTTLRGNLGLPLPENRYTAARQQAALLAI